MKKSLVPVLAALSLASAFTAPVRAAEAESALSFNAGAVTDYRYRGISQSRLKPALQGGADYADKSGFYVGAWGSTIKWIKDSGASEGPVELDLYGGYKGTAGDFGYDVGFLRYEYVNNKLGNVPGYVNANTNEVYGALSYGIYTAKYSHAVSDLFGNANSKNSGYLDLSASIDLGEGYSLVPHVGRQVIKNNGQYSYTDYSLTLAKDFGNGFSATAALVGTNTDAYRYLPTDKNLGKSGLVLGAKYSF
ncbi:MAG: hypothetical protein RJA36_3465 [Pseudomonadota bacterium]|jgi:uncharacterized protein (TIGR02001 family)